MELVYDVTAVAPNILALLRELGKEFPLRETGDGLRLVFTETPNADRLTVRKIPAGMEIQYGKTSAAARGIGYTLAGCEADESLDFKTFAVLFDCSRNPVLTVPYAQHWLRRLALLGYNMMMLYTKDAYQLPDEPYFGYMRGAYSQEEIRAMDGVAKALGIEMIASIQALGHLEPILRWPAYGEVKDTDNVILVDCEKSYALIRKMLEFWSGALSSRRIHIGMDETHDLGRGRFQDLYGKQNAFDLYNRHLRRVCDICNDLQLRPMIWSDMYFRLGNKNLEYYNLEAEIPREVKAAIAPEAQLVYWDYYHTEEAFYRRMLQLHRDLGTKPVVMASGIWTWPALWYDHEQTVSTVRPCLKACRAEGVREILFALWGDDGGYCDFDSAFAGLAWTADEAFNGGADDERVAKLFQAIFHADYPIQLVPSDLQIRVRETDIPPEQRRVSGNPPWRLHASNVLWDDPLMGIVWHEYGAYKTTLWTDYLENLSAILEKLEPFRSTEWGAGHIDHAWHCADALKCKVQYRLQLCKAYQERDFAELRVLAEEKLDRVLGAIDGLNLSFRRQWTRSFKYDGLEVMQIKLGGLKERYRETGRRIRELINGTIHSIPELEQTPLTMGVCETRYRMVATGSWFI